MSLSELSESTLHVVWVYRNFPKVLCALYGSLGTFRKYSTRCIVLSELSESMGENAKCPETERVALSDFRLRVARKKDAAATNALAISQRKNEIAANVLAVLRRRNEAATLGLTASRAVFEATKYSETAGSTYAAFFTFAPELVIRCSTV